MQWLSGRVLDSRPRDRRFKPHRHHCVVSLSKNINISLVLVKPRKTRPYITPESNQTNKKIVYLEIFFERVDFEKNRQTTKKHEKRGKELKEDSYKEIYEPKRAGFH